jgi:hypothetical protein
MPLLRGFDFIPSRPFLEVFIASHASAEVLHPLRPGIGSLVRICDLNKVVSEKVIVFEIVTPPQPGSILRLFPPLPVARVEKSTLVVGPGLGQAVTPEASIIRDSVEGSTPGRAKSSNGNIKGQHQQGGALVEAPSTATKQVAEPGSCASNAVGKTHHCRCALDVVFHLHSITVYRFLSSNTTNSDRYCRIHKVIDF